jgi:hypothetical protein
MVMDVWQDAWGPLPPDFEGMNLACQVLSECSAAHTSSVLQTPSAYMVRAALCVDRTRTADGRRLLARAGAKGDERRYRPALYCSSQVVERVSAPVHAACHLREHGVLHVGWTLV